VTHPLLSWYLAQLQADERLVSAVEAEVGPQRAGEPYSDGSGIASGDAYPSYPWGSPDVELEFMERWHPRSVLALIAAHRAILTLHSPAIHQAIRYDQPHGEPGLYCPTCIGGTPCECCPVNHPDNVWPCNTVRVLVSTHASRDGFDPSWGPT